MVLPRNCAQCHQFKNEVFPKGFPLEGKLSLKATDEVAAMGKARRLQQKAGRCGDTSSGPAGHLPLKRKALGETEKEQKRDF